MNNTNSKLLFAAQLGFTFLICAFLVVPVVLSILAGITANYFVPDANTRIKFPFLFPI